MSICLWTGLSIEANANKYSFVWKKSTTTYETRLLSKLDAVHEQMCQRYGVLAADAATLLSALESSVAALFEHGRGKRKSQEQRDIELLRGLLERKAKYAGYQRTFQGRSSFSKTDPDATFMHMKEDHMCNARLKPGYNVQLGVEGEYITGLSVSSDLNDKQALIPLLESMKAHTGREYQDVTADAGYESKENHTCFEGRQTACYIKPQNDERSKTRQYKSNMALRENMAYDPAADEYTCQQGKKLQAQYEGIRKSKSGFVSMVTYYECEDCGHCSKKKQRTRSKGNRKLQVSKVLIAQRARSLEHITSEKGILLRMNRSIQPEGAFGVIRQNDAFRQFLLRGRRKMLAELYLLSMAYDVNKLHAKIQQNRTGKQLFEKRTA